jgi:uncharacterized protein (TIGR02647 family)
MPYTPELVHELNTLLRFNPETIQQGIKVRKDADPALIAAAERLYAKGLITLRDGGFLTDPGREAAAHAQAILAILDAHPEAVKSLV